MKCLHSDIGQKIPAFHPKFQPFGLFWIIRSLLRLIFLYSGKRMQRIKEFLGRAAFQNERVRPDEQSGLPRFGVTAQDNDARMRSQIVQAEQDHIPAQFTVPSLGVIPCKGHGGGRGQPRKFPIQQDEVGLLAKGTGEQLAEIGRFHNGRIANPFAQYAADGGTDANMIVGYQDAHDGFCAFISSAGQARISTLPARRWKRPRRGWMRPVWTKYC